VRDHERNALFNRGYFDRGFWQYDAEAFPRFFATAAEYWGPDRIWVCLSLALKTIDLSSAYATWSGVGTALTALIGLVLFNETIHIKGFIGLALVICGVIVLNLSKKQKEENKEQIDQTEWTS